MKKKSIITLVIYVAVLGLLFAWISGAFSERNNQVSYDQILMLIKENHVNSIQLQGTEIRMSLKNPYNGKTEVAGIVAYPELFLSTVGPELEANQVQLTIAQSDPVSPYDWILPLLIVGLVMLVLWFLLMSRAQSAGSNMSNFGKARTVLGVPGGKKVTFDDVAGAEEEKLELQEVVDFLRNPEKFRQIGARIPHGMLLVGPPGTGKTLLARAVAGEADVQFLSISGSDFVEMYVGVGASRVRDLFEQAKKIAPAIIFIDEIDAVGRKRGSGLGGGHDEKEQTLNQLLVEMDGFTKNEGVIVLAATNRPDILDPALLRPGRFDRQIYVGAPDAKGREEILKVHAKDKKLDSSVNLKTIALSTAGFTGADLSNLLNEAAILAARENRPVLTMEDLNEAMMKVMAGPEKRSRVRLAKDQKLTAFHEAGHAVAMYHLPTHDPVRQISIIPRGRALGLTWSQPTEDSAHMTRNEMYEQIVGLLGGRVAEALFLGDISTGASNDIDRASKLARDMVARYGMNEALGTVSYLDDSEVFIGRDYEKTKSYSETVASTIDEQVKLLIDKAYNHCADILKANEDKLKAVVDFLLEQETMTGQQFKDCMEGRAIGESSPTSLLDTPTETE